MYDLYVTVACLYVSYLMYDVYVAPDVCINASHLLYMCASDAHTSVYTYHIYACIVSDACMYVCMHACIVSGV